MGALDVLALLDKAPAVDKNLLDEGYVDYTAIPAPKVQTSFGGILNFLPIIIGAVFVFFLLRRK